MPSKKQLKGKEKAKPAEGSESLFTEVSTSSGDKSPPPKARKVKDQASQEQEPQDGQQQAPQDQQDQDKRQDLQEESSGYDGDDDDSDVPDHQKIESLLTQAEADYAVYYIKHHEFIFDRKMKDFGNVQQISEAFEELANLLDVPKDKLVKWYNHMTREFQLLISYISRNPQTYYLNDRTENIHNTFYFLLEHLPVPVVSPQGIQDSSDEN